jgi:hypothetical protein
MMTPSHIPSSRRRGGAPRGNTNALKHGFYSRRFRKSEADDLEQTSFTGLRDEIAMLRVCLRRIVEWGAAIKDFSDAMTFMRTISLGTGSLSRLISIQKAIGGTDFESVIAQAVSEVSQELGITAPPRPEETGNDQADFFLKLFSRAKDEE